MKKTQHSIIRCQQRGIRETNLELIMSLGRMIKKPGGALELFIGKKERQQAIHLLKRRIQDMDKLVGKAVIVSDDGSTIITAYHKN